MSFWPAYFQYWHAEQLLGPYIKENYPKMASRQIEWGTWVGRNIKHFANNKAWERGRRELWRMVNNQYCGWNSVEKGLYEPHSFLDHLFVLIWGRGGEKYPEVSLVKTVELKNWAIMTLSHTASVFEYCLVCGHLHHIFFLIFSLPGWP